MSVKEHLSEIKGKFGTIIKDPEIFHENRIRFSLDRTHLIEVVVHLKKELGFNSLSCISGIDFEEKGIGVSYFINCWGENDPTIIIINVILNDLNDLNLPSINNIYGAADWHEREIYDLFGVKFENHPNLKRLLLPEEWDEWEHKHISELFPMRRSYKLPEKPYSFKPGPQKAVERGKVGGRKL